MKRCFFSIFFLIPYISFCQTQVLPAVEPGVSRNLATFRKAHLTDVKYKLSFDIPSDQKAPVRASEVVSFKLSSENRMSIQMDYKGDGGEISALKINGLSALVNYKNEHLLLAADALKSGYNTVQIEFSTNATALNRNQDYLYTLFVPDRARTVFPCFDQPDLKATFQLKLEVPKTWKAIANGSLTDTLIVNDRKTCFFETSDQISTYLFSFAAGKYKTLIDKVGKYNAEFLYRETDPVKLKLSLDSVFKRHTEAVNFLSSWTGVPYPFQKIGFVAVPDFQFGGMEHVGAVQYKSSTLFLDEGATKDQLISRANLISHETAHMWFGDLVSIDWFNDVWMKEVFANFMADKVMEKLTGTESFNLKFLTDHFPAAYSIDRTPGANPIRQDLDNLNQAGSLYGNIIYHKAPIVMRQLERLMGKQRFQAGVHEYLKKYAYSNASWPDLIAILNKHSNVNLLDWNTVWVNEAGRPVFDFSITYSGSKIKSFNITQQPEYGPKKVWSEIFELSLIYADHIKQLSVNMTGEHLELKEAAGLSKPLYIVFNSTGSGYGVWPVDTQMLPTLFAIKSPVMRASAYVSLYENMLNGRTIKPAALLTLFAEGLRQEKEELNLRLLTGYINSLFWNYTIPGERQKVSKMLEFKIWSSMEHQLSPNNKKLLFKAFQDVFLNREAYQKLAYIWKLQQAPAGIKLTEDDYTSLAFSLSLRNFADSNILAQQLERITNPDRRKRFEFIMPAVSADSAVRDAFFLALGEVKNRSKESNVISALYYLHHPLRQQQSVKYLQKTLVMLEEIQATGDIFFPQSWLQSSFSSYQDKKAMQVISNFLASHPNYNPKLKAKILQAADPVFRAQRLLH